MKIYILPHYRISKQAADTKALSQSFLQKTFKLAFWKQAKQFT